MIVAMDAMGRYGFTRHFPGDLSHICPDDPKAFFRKLVHLLTYKCLTFVLVDVTL